MAKNAAPVKRDRDIDYILENFDFWKVHEYMILRRWRWVGRSHSPGITELKEHARDMLYRVKHDPRLMGTSSGGFTVSKRDGGLRLEFSETIASMSSA